MKVTVGYTPKYMNWQLGKNHPTNPVRAQLALALLQQMPGLDLEILDPSEILTSKQMFDAAQKVHNTRYLRDVQRGVAHEWAGANKTLGETAFLMFGGTQVLVDRIVNQGKHTDRQTPGVYFNPQGAKHHAMYDYSSGFCVLNDMAYAAETLRDAGRKVVYVDWDGHHGDGVEELLRDQEDILTISIHDSTAFPGTGNEDGLGYINYALDRGAGDVDLRECMEDVRRVLLTVQPDVILLACGGDGLAGDPLTSLTYTQEGLDHASRMIGSVARRLNADVLIGGAGGYQPYDEVPEHWSRCVSTIAKWLSI